jgi:hypothetical protein
LPSKSACSDVALHVCDHSVVIHYNQLCLEKLLKFVLPLLHYAFSLAVGHAGQLLCPDPMLSRMTEGMQADQAAQPL